MIRTFEFTESQLYRAYELDRAEFIRIWHLMHDDLTDRYVALIDCDDRLATWLSLI
jgi:hypothetical protein